MKTIVEILDLYTVLERLSVFAATPLGKKMTLRTYFYPKSSLENKLLELDQAMQLLQRFGSWPIHPLMDLESSLRQIEKGRVARIEDVIGLRIDGKMMREIGQYMQSVKAKFPLIEQLFASLQPLETIYPRIHGLLNDQHVIVDHASPTLSGIRKQLKKLDGQMVALIQRLVNTYANSLTESSYSVRNGQYVLPVITSQKQKVPGLVEDVSDTGLTTFITPLAIVQLQQEKQK